MIKSTTLPVCHERTYEMKVKFPSYKINLSFFPFFPSKSFVNFWYSTGISERLKTLKLDESITHSICDYSQLDKITKKMCTPFIQDFSFQFSIFYDGALAPVHTRHCFTIFALNQWNTAWAWRTFWRTYENNWDSDPYLRFIKN